MNMMAKLDDDWHESLHVFRDPQSGLRAVIAIHSTHLGPAVGGCRIWRYSNEQAAVQDALRLSQGMSYKNAMAGLPAGGGKAVLLASPGASNRAALLTVFGQAVESLGGRYITAEDVGSSVADMGVVREHTSYVAGLPSEREAAGGDPSPFTAEGVFIAMQAAVRWRLGRDLDGLRVAVQGIGSVGRNLCVRLHAAGARLVVADPEFARVQEAADSFGADVEDVAYIHRSDVDVFAPCALGAGLNAGTIPQIVARVICGAANNQLAEPNDGALLLTRGVAYCPDYVVNAGGIINAMAERLGAAAASVDGKVAEIGPRIVDLLERAAADTLPTNIVADTIARRLIGR